MGQRTLAITRLLLRIFNLVALEGLDHLVATLDLRFLETRKRVVI
jgi:hypothetical protein